jgi:gluconokinase
MMDVILALDIGSSSIRCTAYAYSMNNETGVEVEVIEGCSSSIPVRSVQPNAGTIHLQYGTKETLLDKVDACVDKVVVQLRKMRTKTFRVVAVGFSSFVMNLIAVDAQGTMLGDEFSISYACNAPAVAQECQSIRDELGEEGTARLYQTTGAPIHSAYALPQLRALYKSHPEAALRRIFKWQSLASLCLCRWTGHAVLPISYSEASWTGLLNVRDCAYEYTATELLPPSCLGSLPSLADFFETAHLRIPELFSIPGSSSSSSNNNKYWSLWPELRTAQLFLGIGDGACANIGSKCSTGSRVAVTIGTSAAARVCLRTDPSCSFTVPIGLFCYRVDKSHILVGGALTDGGSVIEWASQCLNLSTDEAFLDCVNKTQELADADYLGGNSKATTNRSNHVTMIPFLSGERSTGFRDGASGAVMGITRDTTPAHIFKACLESVSLRLRDILQLIQEARGDSSDTPPLVIVSGNALESNAMWRQMVADSSGLQVVLDLETREGTSRGVARLVAVALAATKEGATRDTSEFLLEEDLRPFKTSEPRPTATAYFDRAAQAQDKFIEAMSPLFLNR